jgi:hypothetical protein
MTAWPALPAITMTPPLLHHATGHDRYWSFERAKIRQRKSVAQGLAEGEELGSNGL